MCRIHTDSMYYLDKTWDTQNSSTTTLMTHKTLYCFWPNFTTHITSPPFVTRPPPTYHGRTRHHPRHQCDRGRSPCSAMPPPAKRRVLTKDRRRLGGWLSPRRCCASPPALSAPGTAMNARRCARCARPRVDPFLTCFGRYLVNGSQRFVGN